MEVCTEIGAEYRWLGFIVPDEHVYRRGWRATGGEIIRTVHVSALQVHLERLQNEINVVLQCNP